MTGRFLPCTLRARIFLILFLGLAAAYGLSFTVLYVERYVSARAAMLGTLESDVATSIAVLDGLPASDRVEFVEPLSRGNYRLMLGKGLPGVPDNSQHGTEIAALLEDAVGRRFPVTVESIPDDTLRLPAHLTLSDGSPLTIDIHPRGTMPVANWLPYVFLIQMSLLVLCVLYAVRQALRPLEIWRLQQMHSIRTGRVRR